jgi:hypothetical protein
MSGRLGVVVVDGLAGGLEQLHDYVQQTMHFTFMTRQRRCQEKGKFEPLTV